MATILCIEDEDALRKDIVEELIDEGYQVLSGTISSPTTSLRSCYK